MSTKSNSFSTKAVHAGAIKDNSFGSLSTPIYQSSTFFFETAEQGGARFAGEADGYIYTRLGNPTTSALESRIAALEGAEAAAAAASGMGAISSVFWTILQAGDHVLADETLYGCTYAFLRHGLSRFGVEVSFVDLSAPGALAKALKDNTKIVYFETPCNPNMKIIDIKEVCDITHQHSSQAKVIVDNTFATPYLTRPIELGCDVVVHSATKFLNGHGDVIAGMICGSNEFITECKLLGIKDMTGAVLSPQDAYYILRGLKTLDVRMRRHCENGLAVAQYLESHPKVQKVYYPGLPSFDGHEIAKRQMTGGYGGVVAFEVVGGLEAGKKLTNTLELCLIAVSLGDCETLIEHPASMTHSPYSAEERHLAGISDGLVRISLGLEDAADIIADLAQALQSID